MSTISASHSLPSKIYNLVNNHIVLCSAITLCACCFGMLVMALLIGLYYSFIFPTHYTASLEAPGMYDYTNDYHDLRIKKDMTHQEEEDSLNKYYDTSKDDNLHRPKRTETTPSPSTVNTSLDTVASSTSSMYTDNSKLQTVTNNGTKAVPEEDNFGISPRFIDSVFKYATDTDMIDPLGLCRSSTNVKTPQFNASLLPPEDANEILFCLNDVLKNMTMGNLCIQLDTEMDAYLRWLVLTGEPRKKPPKHHESDDVLFPSSCEDENSKYGSKLSTTDSTTTC